MKSAAVFVAACIMVSMFTFGSPSIALAKKGSPASSQAMSSPAMSSQNVSAHATGPFEVKITPQEDKPGTPTLSRMSIDKTFHGDLEATSQGQMLAASTDVKGSAGYVAMERVTGALHTPSGVRNGSFVLQHFGTMAHGAFDLNVSVVPDSGTGQLVGLTGKMKIIIADGKHSYDFDYTVP